MDDSELTRKAIAELMTEMDDRKEKENYLPSERKKNPLGKPNKQFLGRTISSIMKHNKRQDDRNLRRCERKLKELDAKKSKHERKKRCKDYGTKLNYTTHVSSSDSSNDGIATKSTKRKKRKRRKKKCRSLSSTPSSTSSSSSSATDSSSSSNLSSKRRKKKRHKIKVKEEECDQTWYNNYIIEPTVGSYMVPNMAYAAMAYSQMNHIMQQQELQLEVMVEKELEESVDIPSDLNISCHSSPQSSLNISLHSSSAEEDENGVITFKLSSDDEENVSHISQDINNSSINEDKEIIFSIDCEDQESVHSHISLESKESQKSIAKGTNEIYVLSSSDSDELEIVERITENSSK